jgi:hypothetical protein
MKKAIGYVVSAVALSSAFGIIHSGDALAAGTADMGLIETTARSLDGQEAPQTQSLNETRMFPISGWHESQMHARNTSLHGGIPLGIDALNAKGNPRTHADANEEGGGDHSGGAADTAYALPDPGMIGQNFLRNDLQAATVREVAAQALADAAEAAAAAALAAALAAQQSPPPGNHNPGNHNNNNNNPGVLNNNQPLIQELGNNNINNLNNFNLEVGENINLVD